MNLSEFYSGPRAGDDTTDPARIRISREQASDFAKRIAGDFNPIHDIDAKRFCVPGDLLFALMLERYGVATSTQVEFAGMVTDQVTVELPASIDSTHTVIDTDGREYLSLALTGPRITDAGSILDMARVCVEFSGRTFPDILVELMQQHQVMINPARPLVIYKSISLAVTDADNLAPQGAITLEAGECSLETEGKKGQALLRFALHCDGREFARGEKSMMLGGLRPYDGEAMDAIVVQYREWQQAYAATLRAG